MHTGEKADCIATLHTNLQKGMLGTEEASFSRATGFKLEARRLALTQSGPLQSNGGLCMNQKVAFLPLGRHNLGPSANHNLPSYTWWPWWPDMLCVFKISEHFTKRKTPRLTFPFEKWELWNAEFTFPQGSYE